MQGQAEKRIFDRKAGLERCSVELYSSNKGPLASRIVNYSSRGLMIELDQPLTKGEPVKIRFKPEMTEANRLGETYCMGMVRWCSPQDGVYSALYGVGLEMSASGIKKKLPKRF